MSNTESYQQLKQIIHDRRSVRSFTDQPVDKALIRELIDCARYAPSDTNSQTWEFIAVVGRQAIEAIEAMTWEQLNLRAAAAEAKGLNREARLLLKSFGPYATAFSDAPALIICLATPYTSKFRDKIFDPIQLAPEDVWREEGIKSSCLASQNLMLAAHSLGLATCPMTGPVLLAEQQLKDYLEVEESRQVNMVIALGYPAAVPGKLPRKEVEEILRFVD